MKTNEFNLGTILAPAEARFFTGYTETDRDLELIRLGSAAPVGCHGYIDHLRRGARRVQLDAARQLAAAGIVWNVEIPAN